MALRITHVLVAPPAVRNTLPGTTTGAPDVLADERHLLELVAICVWLCAWAAPIIRHVSETSVVSGSTDKQIRRDMDTIPLNYNCRIERRISPRSQPCPYRRL